MLETPARLAAIAVTFAALAAGEAAAAPYVLMHWSDQVVTFADQETVRPAGPIKVLWTYTVPRRDLSDGSGVMAAKTEVDCRAQRFRDVYAATYNWRGDRLQTSETPDEWTTVVPGTFNVRLIALACQGSARELVPAKGSFLDAARVVRARLVDGR